MKCLRRWSEETVAGGWPDKTLAELALFSPCPSSLSNRIFLFFYFYREFSLVFRSVQCLSETIFVRSVLFAWPPFVSADMASRSIDRKDWQSERDRPGGEWEGERDRERERGRDKGSGKGADSIPAEHGQIAILISHRRDVSWRWQYYIDRNATPRTFLFAKALYGRDSSPNTRTKGNRKISFWPLRDRSNSHGVVEGPSRRHTIKIIMITIIIYENKLCTGFDWERNDEKGTSLDLR